MATSGGALRHSFVTPVAHDPRPTLSRTPSLPSQFADKRTRSTRTKKRPSGLFESSSESDPEPSDEDQSPVRQQSKSRRDDTSTASRHNSLQDRYANNSSSSSQEQRKGLFEIDDDAADSVETLRERVKQRQKKKETEFLNLRKELDAALAHVRTTEEALQAERKEKEEFAIRMNECQRIIEKRNKQLIKASEKLARLAEQSDAQASELQSKINELTDQVAQAYNHGEATREQLRNEYEEKLTRQRAQFEADLDKMKTTAADALQKKDHDVTQLRKRVAQLEDDVVTAASRIAESSEYQILLKRCEDAEAISRGLRFQLEKAQNEKKQLKKQLLASQSTQPSSAYMPSTDLFAELSGTAGGSPASSVASGDLANFDYFSSQHSPPTSPVATPPPPPSSSTSSSSSRKPSLKIATDASAAYGSRKERSSKPSSADSRESVYGTSNDGNDTDPPPPPAPLSASQSEKTERSESRTRPGSGTINFFEKMTIKFKRSSSSPKGVGGTKTFDEQDSAKASTLFGAPSATTPSAPIDIPPSGLRRNILPNRPKMYVAKSPSEHEESSDSIFGSDSSESDVSSSDGEAGDEPPPPPPSSGARSRTPPSSTGVDLPGVTASPPLPPLFGDPSDADSSSLSSDDEADGDVPGREKLRRVVLPVPSPPAAGEAFVGTDSKRTDERDQHSSSDSSSDPSESESSDESDHDGDEEQPVRTGRDPRPSSDPDAIAPDDVARRKRHASTDTTSNSKSSGKRDSSPSRREKRERSRSTEAGENSATAKVNRMNEYMEARARKRQEKLSKKEERETAEHKKREEYEKEWERMAQEERERRRKQQQARRTGKRRPSSMKTVRVSQMRQQMNKQHQSKDAGGVNEDTRDRGDESEDDEPPRPDRQQSDSDSGESSDDGEQPTEGTRVGASSTPLPPEPTAADTELYIRQQARLRERHEMEMKKRQDADEADQVRGQIHRRIEMWAFGKELLHLILTLDQISTNDALKQCQLMVVQSPDADTLRKAYRNIIRVIHPDKLRNASIAEQLEAKELFTVLNQAFEKFKGQN